MRQPTWGKVERSDDTAKHVHMQVLGCGASSNGLLGRALWLGNLKVAKELVRRGADPHAMVGDETMLGVAATAGRSKAVEWLLSIGASPTKVNDYEMCALEMAVGSRSRECVVALIKAGADPNQGGRRHSALAAAAAMVCDQAVEDLLAWGANPNGPPHPLAGAAARGHENIVRMLLDAGAKADESNIYGMPALGLAIRHGHEEVSKMLAAASSDRTIEFVLSRQMDAGSAMMSLGLGSSPFGSGFPGSGMDPQKAERAAAWVKGHLQARKESGWLNQGLALDASASLIKAPPPRL